MPSNTTNHQSCFPDCLGLPSSIVANKTNEKNGSLVNELLYSLKSINFVMTSASKIDHNQQLQFSFGL